MIIVYTHEENPATKGENINAWGHHQISERVYLDP
jgi:hypothetical protein